MRVNETCGACGGGLSASSDDRAALTAVLMSWRDTHPCPARQRGEREVVAGAQTEQSYAGPHRTDTELGFVIRPDPTVPEVREILGYAPTIPGQRGPADTPADT